jgi:hypothetical protein
MPRKLQKDFGSSETKHLFWMADYYDRLGCGDVARSLRDLAAAKKWRAQRVFDRPRYDLAALGLTVENGG